MSRTNSAEHTAIDADERSAAQASVPLSEASRSCLDDGSPQAITSPAIHAVGLSKRFGDTIAVDSLSMTVRRGEVFGFLGPNGAGKTTVVKLLLGLARLTGGEALVLGAPLGATLDTATGVFSFRPDETQGVGSFTVTFTVDDGAGGTDSQEVQIDVAESDTGEGDVDQDGDVDAADIATVALYFGQPAGVWPEADVDGNGTIGGGDFAMVIMNWGNRYN